MALLAQKSPSCRLAIVICCIVLLTFLVFSQESWQSHGVGKFQFQKPKLIDQPDNSDPDDFWKMSYEERSEVRTCSGVVLGRKSSNTLVIIVPEEESG